MANQLAAILPPEGEKALGDATLDQIRSALDQTGLEGLPDLRRARRPRRARPPDGPHHGRRGPSLRPHRDRPRPRDGERLRAARRPHRLLPRPDRAGRKRGGGRRRLRPRTRPRGGPRSRPRRAADGGLHRRAGAPLRRLRGRCRRALPRRAPDRGELQPGRGGRCRRLRPRPPPRRGPSARRARHLLRPAARRTTATPRGSWRTSSRTRSSATASRAPRPPGRGRGVFAPRSRRRNGRTCARSATDALPPAGASGNARPKRTETP